MTHLVDRLGELRRHLAHLRTLQPRVRSPEDLRQNLSLHNDVLFSLLTVCQLVIDISAELSSSRGLAFEDYTAAVRNLTVTPGLPEELVERLSRLPGFRNAVVHEYVALDLSRVVAALNDLDPLERFAEGVADFEARGE